MKKKLEKKEKCAGIHVKIGPTAQTKLTYKILVFSQINTAKPCETQGTTSSFLCGMEYMLTNGGI